MRLPLCVKIDKQHNIEKRPLTITGDSSFSDFILSDYKNCQLVFENIIHFDEELPIDPGRLCDQHPEGKFNIGDNQIINIISNKTNTLDNNW